MLTSVMHGLGWLLSMMLQQVRMCQQNFASVYQKKLGGEMGPLTCRVPWLGWCPQSRVAYVTGHVCVCEARGHLKPLGPWRWRSCVSVCVCECLFFADVHGERRLCNYELAEMEREEPEEWKRSFYEGHKTWEEEPPDIGDVTVLHRRFESQNHKPPREGLRPIKTFEDRIRAKSLKTLKDRARAERQMAALKGEDQQEKDSDSSSSSSTSSDNDSD